MKKFLMVSVLINLIFNLIAYCFLPDTVASHFHSGGVPNGFMTREEYVMLFVCLDLFVAAMFYSLPVLIKKLPVVVINLPNKEYWLSTENKERTIIKLKPFVYECGAVTLLFLLLCSVLGFTANQNVPRVLNEMTVLTGMSLYVIYIIVWCVKFVKAFQIPEGSLE